MIGDWDYDQLRIRAKKLEAEGYTLTVFHNKYSVSYNGEVIRAAGTLSSSKPKHWRNKLADLRDNLQSAVTVAERHKAGRETDKASNTTTATPSTLPGFTRCTKHAVPYQYPETLDTCPLCLAFGAISIDRENERVAAIKDIWKAHAMSYAKLMAVAPDMLSALERLVSAEPPGKTDDPMTFTRKNSEYMAACSEARRVIREAKGG